MGREAETVTVDGDTYQIKPLGAVKGKALWDRLARAIGGGAASIVASASAGTVEAQAGAVLGAMAAIPQDLLNDLDEAFAASSKVKMQAGFLELGNAHTEDNIFDQHFSGAYEKLMQWRVACLKVNFAGFLGKLASFGATKKAAPIQ